MLRRNYYSAYYIDFSEGKDTTEHEIRKIHQLIWYKEV